MCHLYWANGCPDSWSNNISGCVCKGVGISRWVTKTSPTSVGDNFPVYSGLERNAKVEEGWIPCPFLSWDVHLLLDVGVIGSWASGQWFPSSLDFNLWPGFHCWLPCFFDFEGSNWRTPLAFPSLACSWQTVGLLSLHNGVSHLLINILFCLSNWFYFSGETWVIHLLYDGNDSIYLLDTYED